MECGKEIGARHTLRAYNAFCHAKARRRKVCDGHRARFFQRFGRLALSKVEELQKLNLEALQMLTITLQDRARDRASLVGNGGLDHAFGLPAAMQIA